ncbi:TonB-dependent siderophore receptor [Oxalicibacterium solurbis]|uniref:Ferrioxamine receptor FoxA n=1 Tax=Oxalicibacterium solurbis TaxID=69280 RepID=A0A8J3F509_9BURK|nr:TonB-dependent siderophore receptor [Oxalicibacterium solurbis]GGI55037.1 ferrioxamine receptor FoxA [Oxalicibacterium solurbis]
MTRISFRPAAVALAVALACGTAPSFAQSAATPVSINIVAQPLAQALNELARQAQLELIVQPSLVAGKTAPAVSGSLTPQQALNRLLAGSGLVATVNGKTAVVNLVPASSGQLPAVTVTAAMENDSYVATRSASGFKTDTPIIETPQSVSVVTRKQIEDQKPRSVTEALAYTPGAFTGLVGSSNRYDYVALRGFKDSSVDSALLDGLRMLSDQGSYTSMQVDPYYLERIDVIRGPASVMYGRASPGGLVALTSKMPQFEAGREVQFTLGNNDRREASVDLTGPLDENGVMAFRLTATARKNDTQVNHVKEERYVLAPSLAINFSKNTHLLLQAYLQDDPEGSYHSGVPYDASVTKDHNGRRLPRDFYDGDPSVDTYERKQRFLGYQFSHAFDDNTTVRQNFRYVWADATLRQIHIAPLTYPPTPAWISPTQLFRSYDGASESTRGFTIDNQFEKKLKIGTANHTFLVGLDYQKRDVEGSWSWGSVSPIDAFNPVYGSPNLVVTGGYDPVDRTLEQTGFYAQDQIELGQWRFTLGARQDWADMKMQRGLADIAKWDGSKLTARAGAVYLFENGLAPYISYSDGFNPSLRSDGNKILEPAESNQTEIGIRYQPSGSRTLLSAAIYNLTQDNISILLPTTFDYIPAGKTRSRGLELEAHTQVSDNVSLLASYTYNRTKFVESPDGNLDNTPAQAPRNMASIWGDWTFLPGYTWGAGLRYVGTSWVDNANTVKVPSYTIADMMLRIDLSKWNPSLKGTNLRLAANNLFDKTYVASCQDQNFCYWGDERSLTATLTYKW